MNLDKKMWENLPEKPNLKPKCRSIWKKTPKRFRKNSLTFGRKRGRLKMKYNLRWPFLCLQKKSGKPKLRSVRTCPSP